MKLILSHGYPYPYPLDLTEAQQAELSHAAPAYQLVIQGVKHFEQKHTTTVEFVSDEAWHTAQAITGWKTWATRILEAPTDAENGLAYDAFIVANVAYCGHVLVEEALPPLFYVRDADGDHDLLVRAATAADVLVAWRKHFELDSEDDPNYIGRVPDTNGALDWDVITTSALQFKPMAT